MTQNDLTGIERQLVLEYLIDGNAPVTITQEESDAAATGKAVSRIFPVAVRAEQMTVLNQGIILLKDAPESVQYFDGKRVRVQFYFNKLGLYFTSTVKRTRHALALVIPDVISRIRDAEPPQSSDMSCVLYFEAGKEKRTGALHVDCRTESPYSLFTVPKWSDVEESEQQKAKSYLEKTVAQSRAKGTAIGNGLFLIPICRYLAHEDLSLQAVADRRLPPTVLYINQERIVFGYGKNGYALQKGSEYALKLGFPLKNSPVKERTVYVTCTVQNLFASDDGARFCADCRYTSLKKEDERFLDSLC